MTDALRRQLADRGYTLVEPLTGLDPDPLRPDDEPDDDPPAVIAWGCLAAIGWAVIVGVLLLIAFRQPVAG